MSHHQAAPELARWFACFQFDQKSAADPCCQGKLMLSHIQGFPPASDERAKGQRHLRCPPASDAFVIIHELPHVPARELSGQKLTNSLKMCLKGNTLNSAVSSSRQPFALFNGRVCRGR
jgi:hypothetical protein